MFSKLYKFSKLVMYLNSCSMDLGHDNMQVEDCGWLKHLNDLHGILIAYEAGCNRLILQHSSCRETHPRFCNTQYQSWGYLRDAFPNQFSLLLCLWHIG